MFDLNDSIKSKPTLFVLRELGLDKSTQTPNPNQIFMEVFTCSYPHFSTRSVFIKIKKIKYNIIIRYKYNIKNKLKYNKNII